MSRFGDWTYRRQKRTDRMMVTQDRGHYWRVVGGELALFGTTVVAMLGLQLLDPGPLRVACAVLVGLQVGRAGIISARRALAYRSGWMDGRAAMVQSMGEAMRRRMDLNEWLRGEAERDMATLGIPVMFMDEPPDGD